jgi:hypothetical protein
MTREVAQFRPRKRADDYAIDIAFRSWDPRKQPEFTEARAGMVGRSQRRFHYWAFSAAGPGYR